MEIIDGEQALLSALGIFKIKYKVLNSLNIGKVDAFHVDINTMLNVIYKVKKIFEYKDNFTFSISSSIVNLCAHFRQYFVKLGYSVPIYLYYRTDKSNIDEDQYEQILTAIKLVEVIAKYIPGMYLISNHDKDIKIPVAVKYFSKKHKHNLMLTKNTEYYQLLSKSFKILRPARDDTYVVNHVNMYNQLAKNEKDYSISPELCSAVLSMVGTKHLKGLPGMGIKKSIKYFQKAIDDSRIVNRYYINIRNLSYDIGIGNEYHIETLIRNFQEIDIEWRYRQRTKSDELKMESFIIDKFAKKDLNEINNRFFTGFNTLMVQELMLEPKHSIKGKKDKIEW